MAKQKQGDRTTALKLLLNKLSTKTEATISRQLMEEIDRHRDEPDYQNEVFPVLFSFLSSNQFYAGLFAKLYATLCQRYAWFREQHTQLVHTHTLFTRWYASAPSPVPAPTPAPTDGAGSTLSSYDLLCNHNKKCDEKKALTAFLCHFYFLTTVEDPLNDNVAETLVNPSLSDWFPQWVSHLVSVLNEKKNGTNATETEEWVEWLFIVFTSVTADEYRNQVRGVAVTVTADGESAGMPVVEMVQLLSKTTAKQCTGWSNKAMFKCLDIMDAVRKWTSV